MALRMIGLVSVAALALCLGGPRADEPKVAKAHLDAAKIGADVDSVGNEQQCNDDLQEPIRIMPTQVAGDAMSRGAPDHECVAR